jgi:hypothetical protein
LSQRWFHCWISGGFSVKLKEKNDCPKNCDKAGKQPEMIDLNQLYRRNENFVFRRIEDETILVPIKDNVGDMGCIYSLNEIAAMIWEHLSGDRDLATIKDKIMAEYEIDSREVEADLCEFVTDLAQIEAVNLVD